MRALFFTSIMAIKDRYAALRPLLAIASGIVISYYLPVTQSCWIILTSILLFLALILHFGAKQIRWVELSGIFLLLSLGCFSAFRYTTYHYVQKDIFKQQEEEIYKGNISKIIKETPDYIRVELQLDSPNTTIISYLSGVTNFPEPGDEILFNGKIEPISPPLNPGQFDTKTYYGYKKIYGQIFLKKGTYVLSKSHRYPIRKFFYRVSSFVRNKITQLIPEENAAALIKGVLLGVRQDLDPELLKIFAHAGIMHILSVSGMHAAILYGGILYLIRGRAKRKPKLRLIPVIGVWLFALLTGAGPAVLRAALIITLTDSGNILKKQVNTLNLLMSSAIFLLILQPYLIWDIGFQLSYAAMLGIILTYRAFSGILYFQNKFFRQYFWEPTAIAVSAQLFTIAPALYYFGIFPASFILSNIITLIPVTLMLFGSILMVLIGSLLPIIGEWIGILIMWVVQNLFLLPLKWIHKIPYAYFEYLHFSFIQLILLTIAMGLLTFWILNPRKSNILLFGLLSLLMAISIGFSEKNFFSPPPPQIIVYHLPHKTVIGITSDHQIHFYGDSNVVANPAAYDFFLSGSYRKYRLHPINKAQSLNSTSSFKSDSSLLISTDYKIFILSPSSAISGKLNQKLKIDYILLSKNPFINADRLKTNFEFKAIILDGNIPPSKRKIYRKILDEGKIPYFDTQERGALILPQKIKYN